MIRPEDDKATWGIALLGFTVPSLIWAHWGFAVVGAVCWGWLSGGQDEVLRQDRTIVLK